MTEQNTNRFLRPKGVIKGVCAALARDLGFDVVLVRIAWLVFLCFGVGFVAYILCWIAFPSEADPTMGKGKRILGVCAAIAKRSQQPVAVIRLIALVLLFVSVGAVLVAYGLALLVIPPEEMQT